MKKYLAFDIGCIEWRRKKTECHMQGSNPCLPLI